MGNDEKLIFFSINARKKFAFMVYLFIGVFYV